MLNPKLKMEKFILKSLLGVLVLLQLGAAYPQEKAVLNLTESMKEHQLRELTRNVPEENDSTYQTVLADGYVTAEGFIIGVFGAVLGETSDEQHTATTPSDVFAGGAIELNDDKANDHVDGKNSRAEGLATVGATSLKREVLTTLGATLPPRPRNPDDIPPSPRAFNVTEIAEMEKKMEQRGVTLNITCSTIDEDTIPGRDGNIGEKYRWNHGFYVYLDPTYDTEARKLINAAMFELQHHLCIPFHLFREGQTPYGNFIHVKNKGPNICKSEVGNIGIGRQNMFLGERCLRAEIIMHQMIHALGFWHEQSRPDRDNYVTINWSNVVHTTRSKFEMIPKMNTFGVEYDTQSIMHLNSKAFSSNGKSTIVAKNGELVGTQHDLQHSDIEKLRTMYNCHH